MHILKGDFDETSSNLEISLGKTSFYGSVRCEISYEVVNSGNTDGFATVQISDAITEKIIHEHRLFVVANTTSGGTVYGDFDMPLNSCNSVNYDLNISKIENA